MPPVRTLQSSDRAPWAPRPAYDSDSVGCKSDGLGDIDTDRRPFFVAHVKPRQEKILAWELDACRVDWFLPLMRVAKLSGRKRYVVREPIFKQYLFIVGDPDPDRHKNIQAATMGTDRILRTIPVNAAQEKILHRELWQIDRALAVDDFIEVCPYAVPGRKCRITNGPFRNMEGKVVNRVEKPDQVSIILEVSVLGQGIELTVDSAYLEPAD